MMPTDNIESPSSRSRGEYAPEIALILTSAILLMWNLGDRGLWHSEGRWAEIPREMTLTGDYFHPTIGGYPYPDKPVMTYWVVIVAARLLGGFSELAARLPSAVASLIVICCTLWMGRRLWSAQVGRIAAAILMTSYGFLFWSRTADADTENLAAIMLAVCWYWARRDRAGFGSFLVFWLIVFLGALMKGLPAVIISVLAILPDVWINKRWRSVLTPAHFVAALIGAIIYFAPFIYASMTRTGAFGASGMKAVFDENFRRFFKAYDHKGPVYLYLYMLPVLLLPWAPVLIGAFAALWHDRKRLEMPTRWLCWTVITIFAFFTASESRRGYYILPLLPLSALLVGIFLTKSADEWVATIRRHTLSIQSGLMGVGVLVALTGPLVSAKAAEHYGVTVPPQLNRSMIVLGVVSAIAGLIAMRLDRIRQQSFRGFWPSVVAATVLVGGYFCWQQGMLESYRSEPAFARELKTHVQGLQPEKVGLYRVSAANLLFYLGLERPPENLSNDRKLQSFLAHDGKRVIVTQRQYTEDAQKLASPDLVGRAPDLDEARHSFSRPSDEDWVAWIIAPGEVRSASILERPN